MTVRLMVGTRKGLWIGSSADRRTWEWSGPHFDLHEIYGCLVHGGRLYAAPVLSWTGPTLQVSDDGGQTWRELAHPRFPDDVEASVERVWQLRPGLAEGELWAGTEPAAIFHSTDAGESWELVRSLWDHPHREHWTPGFGGQAFHTLLPHPTDPLSLTAALSAGGVYRTRDGGRSWQPRNAGIACEFLPEEQRYPEFGQCVHKMDRHPSRPERIFLQNHGGVYRSDDEGDSWTSIAEGLPADFGFPMVVHPREPDTAFVFPLDGSAGRHPMDGKAAVWRTRDAGESWESLSSGLPESFWVGVMRDAMCADDHESPGLYLGARNGSVWVSPDAGEEWSCAISNLPDVMVVRAGVV